MSTLSYRSKGTAFIKHALNEISRESNFNRIMWLKICDGSFTLVTPSGVGAGDASAPQIFGILKNLGKIPKNSGKIPENSEQVFRHF